MATIFPSVIIVFDNKDMEKAFMSQVLEAGTRESVEEGRAEGAIERHQITPWGPQVGKSGKTLEIYQQRIVLLQLQTMMLVAYQKLLKGKIEAKERERFLDGL